MDRILQGTAASVYITFAVDGTATDPDPDSCTVRAVRADGTELQAPIAASEGGAGRFWFTLTPTQTALLDTVTIYWTATLDGFDQTLTTTIEIVGGFLFEIAEARAMTPLNNVTNYPTATIVDMRTTVEDAIETYTGAMVPRYTLDTFTYPDWSRPLVLKQHARVIRSVTIDGVALSTDQLNALTLSSGLLYGLPGAPRRNSVVAVGYEHGRDRPPERVRRAGLLLTKSWLIAGPIDDRTSTFTSQEGGTFSLVTPGRGGSLFGLPEVDAAVQYEMAPMIG